MSEWDINKWLKERKEKRIQSAKNLKELGVYLKDLGYKYIRVWYEGAGDSGECFYAEGWKKEINLEKKDSNGYYPDTYEDKAWNHKNEENFDENKNFTRNQIQLQKEYHKFIKEHPDLKFQGELHWELVDLIDYDWYNNEGGQGQVFWDLEKEIIQIDGQQNVYSCRDTNERYYLNGDDPEYGYGDEIYER